MKPFKTSLYWRVLVWFCVANLLVLVLGTLLAQRFIAYSTALEINWVALAQEADQADEQQRQHHLKDEQDLLVHMRAQTLVRAAHREQLPRSTVLAGDLFNGDVESGSRLHHHAVSDGKPFG